MSALQIREWVEGDLPAVRHITWETWCATYAPFIPVEDLRSYYDEHYSEEALREWMAEGENAGYLALWEDVPGGYIRTHREIPSGRFYVSSLYVLPDVQGAGIGRGLMSVAERRAIASGADRIWLGVMEQNIRTLAWYRKQGFQFVEQAPFRMGRSSVNHFIGYKLIHPEQA